MADSSSANQQTGSETTQSAPLRGAPRGGGRGRGNNRSGRGAKSNRGGGNHQSGTTQQKGSQGTAQAMPSAGLPLNVPLPDFLVSKATAFTDDPLHKESLVLPDEAGLSYIGARQEFTTDAAGYIQIVRQVHTVLAAQSSDFRRNVSESMFVWYGTILFWIRVVSLKKTAGVKVTAEEEAFLTAIPVSLGIPEPMELFLSGMGDVIDTNLITSHWIEVTSPSRTAPIIDCDVNGFFGAIDEASHLAYESLPSPGIAALTILKDLELSVNPANAGAQRNWAIPAPIGCVEPNCGLPTPNLLGYAPATNLTKEQVNLLTSVRVQPNGLTFGRTGSYQFCMNKSLFSKVNSSVLGLTKYSVAKSMPKKTSGSKAQILYQEHEEKEDYTLYEHFLDEKVKTSSASHLENEIAQASLFACYRPLRLEFRKPGAQETVQAFQLRQQQWHNDVQTANQNYVTELQQYGHALTTYNANQVNHEEPTLTYGQNIPGGLVFPQPPVHQPQPTRQMAQGTVVRPWACYYFDHYTQVPQAWQDNANDLIHLVDEYGWNRERVFVTTYSDRSRRLEKTIKSYQSS